VIIAVLAGISVPVYQRVIENGRATGCISNLRQLGIALNLYISEHNATMPKLVAARSDITQDAAAVDNTLNAYTGGAKVFTCPSDNQGLAAKTGTSYYWNSALNDQKITSLNFFTTTDLSHIPILSDKAGFHPYTQNKVNILYADGHATKDLKFSTSP